MPARGIKRSWVQALAQHPVKGSTPIYYLINLRRLLRQGLKIKKEFEEILGISGDDTPKLEYLCY